MTHRVLKKHKAKSVIHIYVSVLISTAATLVGARSKTFGLSKEE